MSALKFCQGCGEYRDRFDFKPIRTGAGVRRSHKCNDCVRKLMIAVNPKKTGGPCPIRQKELALIPNPFAKQIFVHIQDNSNFLWSDCV